MSVQQIFRNASLCESNAYTNAVNALCVGKFMQQMTRLLPSLWSNEWIHLFLFAHRRWWSNSITGSLGRSRREL
jgi:hypothetical protein